MLSLYLCKRFLRIIVKIRRLSPGRYPQVVSRHTLTCWTVGTTCGNILSAKKKSHSSDFLKLFICSLSAWYILVYGRDPAPCSVVFSLVVSPPDCSGQPRGSRHADTGTPTPHTPSPPSSHHLGYPVTYWVLGGY